MKMVHWGWIPITLVIGVVAGFFIIAFLEVVRAEKSGKKAWWDDG